jgi:3',5'-cyclic AMP phosphodiesterase CpdA
MTAPMFVLGHLSDPHLGPLPTPRLRELTGKRVIGIINWRRRRRVAHRAEVVDTLVHDLQAAHPDHIAVTGDLVNVALDLEFAPARQWLSRLGPPDHVTVVPGNHDVYVRSAVQYPARHWGDYMRADGIGSAAPHGRPAHFPFVRRRGQVALIGLSTAVPTGLVTATGKLGAEQLMRLSDALDHLAHQGLFRVVLLHHPPTSTMSERLKRLIDAGPFRRVIAEHGAELVIHGHSHVQSLVWLDGPNQARVPVSGVPSASATLHGRRDPASYNLYRIAGSPGGWQCEAVTRGLRPGHHGIVEIERRRLCG